MKYLENDQKYDVIVVGAGPAGSSAAKAAAENGVNVLLIERELEIGVPDKCGEFLPSLDEMKRLAPDVPGLDKIWDIPKRCIVNNTKYVNFVFPNGVDFPVDFTGHVVERKLFDKHLANQAGRAGAEIMPFTSAIKLLDDGVRVRSGGEIFDLKSDVVIGADGAYSLIAREAGLPISTDPVDYGVGYQFEMVNVDHDPDYVDMYLGEDIAPGTYAWIIPKGKDIANVGTGVRAPFMKRGMTIRDYQRNFVKNHPLTAEKLKNAVPTAVKAGNIPVGGPIEHTTTDNVLVVGDAGGHTIPTVGGGIPPGLIIGKIAGEAAAAKINRGASLSSFDDAWKEQMGDVLYTSLRLRRMSDVVFKSKRMIDIVTKLDWLTKDTISKFIYCKMDAKMKVMERALQSGEIQKLLK
ncbi:geranylgeranyl reductase family protein [Candidatus Bathyarchaeota archaeon]|jgi:digeranylgeranylglycerophospholipid reductase|nr:geranylgeranyl reductase family protein [Candidatus Bathyarchaeota archaeon]MBT4319011.1 geranylgeranyl reductase family protein [Candidatus Bathyarchaeota archaeon]MBT4423301.1 geranylgeranyl reductase family protein [Candidatus Bathyarchaeota archaeon]MBT6604465.1 geranylgeranyl reductase family protein [Candidatus Bathyarchaeota archaeon]MBT7346495.1 geranylgeranyl reductase family protein [Candidatus Bathyarchaeota archaeon]